MKSMAHLLFFDTFSHEVSEAIQLDLVQFPKAVQVSEVRVIPLGARVQADFPGGVRLGATNPSQFEIEYFVNDLSKRGAATFENVGNMKYNQHGNIQLEFDKKVPTDGLLLRGSYNTITLAVYGNLTKVQRDPSPKAPKRNEVPQPPPEKVNTHDRIRDWLEDTQRKQQIMEPPPDEESRKWTTKVSPSSSQLHSLAIPHSPADVEMIEDVPKESWDEEPIERERISRSETRDKKRSAERSRSREDSWDRTERANLRKEIRTDDSSREKELKSERDYENDRIRDKERESKDRDRLREKDLEKEERLRYKEKDRDKEDKRDKEREKDRTKEYEREKDRDLERRKSREKPQDDPLLYEHGVSKGRRSMEEWDERRSERSDRSAKSLRRPQTPVEMHHGMGGISPLCSEEDSHGGTQREYSNREKDKNLSREYDHCEVSKEPVAMLPPISTDEMEAISDDEDLPDLPLEDNPIVEDYGQDDLEDVVDQVEDTDGFGFEEIMSDEEELPEYQYEEEFIVEEWEDWIKPFSPHQLNNLPQLLHFSSPTLTPFEVEKLHWKEKIDQGLIEEEEPAQAMKLLTSVLETAIPSINIDDNMADSEREPSISGDQSTDETGEHFVQTVEQVCQLIPQGLAYISIAKSQEYKDVLNTLLTWVDIGLDFEQALNQQQPIYKIRHLKAGLKLSYTLLQCSSEITDELMKRNVLDKLFSLYDQQHMALSIKLFIIKTIDSITRTKAGLEHFLTKPTSSPENLSLKNGYEKILELMESVRQTRTKVALSAIIRKINLVEICDNFHSDTNDIVQSLPPLTDDERKEGFVEEEPLECEEEIDRSIPLPSNWGNNIADNQIGKLVHFLQDICRNITFAPQLLSQPNKVLPGSKQFQLPKNTYDIYPYIYIILDKCKFLQSIAVLLSCPGSGNSANLISAIHSILTTMISTDHGILYLATHSEVTTTIVKSLLQFCDVREELFDGNSMHQIGSHMIHIFHVIHQMDSIALLSSFRKLDNIDYSQAAVHFNTLLGLTMTYPGKQAIISVFSLGKNVEILFPFLKLKNNDEPDIAPCRMACFGYAIEILTLIIKYQESVDMLECYAEKISEFIEFEDIREGTKSEEHSKLLDLSSWISVAKQIENFSYDNLCSLSTNIKDYSEKLEKFPGELIMSLRILQHLTIPKYSINELSVADHNSEIIEELKYKYSTVQLFSYDLHTHLANLLTKLCNMYQQPFIHSTNFIGCEGALILSVIKPSIKLLKNILSHLVHARNTTFKDLTIVLPLLQTHLLLQAFPLTSPYNIASTKLQKEIVALLLVYTQPIYSASEGEEQIANSLWTKMMSEIFKYMMNSPHTIVGVINLITEMLPIPLPIQTRRPLSEEESSQTIQLRKLWTVHLYSLNSQIHEIIYRLGLATHPALTHSLRKMCIALSDLAAPLAVLVARSTLDLILHTQKLDQKLAGGEEGTIAPCSPQTARVLNMVAALVSHPPTKSAILHLLKGGSPTLAQTSNKGDDKYICLLPSWCSCLTLDSKAPAHLQAQESLISIFQFLCSHENTMHVLPDIITTENSEIAGSSSPSVGQPQSDQYLSGLPNRELLSPMIESLIEYLSTSATESNINQIIRILIKLLDHDSGFYYLKSVLDKKRLVLFHLLKKQVSLFDKDKVEIVSNLQCILEFCHLLVVKDQSICQSSRTLTLTSAELANYLGWKPNCGENQNNLNAGEKKEAEIKIKIEEKEEEPANNEEEESKEESSNIQPKEEKDNVEEEQTPNAQEPSKEINSEDKKSEVIHCLKILQSQLTGTNDEDTLEALLDEVTLIISLLEGENISPSDIKDICEPNRQSQDTLQAMFASRTIWTHLSAEDDLAYWLTAPSFDDADESETVKANLMETCRQYAGDYDLLGTLHKLIKGHGSQSHTPQKINIGQQRYKQSSVAIRPDKRGKPYVAPMRGRSFSRGMNVRSDPFRSRPPNTSRPPSVHVDVFQALESTGNQPTGPTGYNKISFGRGKLLLDSRSRGRSRPDLRGRFFHRPMFRPDNGRGMSRGINVRGRGPWIFRGDGTSRPNYRGAPMNMAPMRMFRGRGPYMRGVSDRFPPKFMERGRRDLTAGRHLRGFR